NSPSTDIVLRLYIHLVLFRSPSTRDFPDAIYISRGTAVIVYEMLQAEGYLAARRGTGTFVAPTLPDDRLVMPKAGLRPSLPPERIGRASCRDGGAVVLAACAY